MNRNSDIVWLGLIVCVFAVLCLGTPLAHADSNEFNQSTRLYPGDYLLQSHEPLSDPVFDHARVVDLSTVIGVGADCGQIDIKNTLRASLGNVLDSKYFGDMGKDILAASPLLLTCYLSPTWCAILKHSQISAHYLSQMRLDQCSLVDKVTDSRVEDFYQARQSCVRQAIDRNGGDMESAMQSCNGNSLWQSDLANWAGGNGGQVASNRLIESSAQWAGMNGPESRGSLDLVKSMVGDTLVSKGTVGVEYGPGKAVLTPRTYLQSVEQTTQSQLCGGLLKRVVESAGDQPIEEVVSTQDLQAISPSTDRPLIDYQTLRALALMGPRQRQIACARLADTIGMTVFTTDMNRSLDVLSTLAQNPNLPDNRRQELASKRQALKDQIELTVNLHQARGQPLNQVLSQINEQGDQLESESVKHGLFQDATRSQSDSVHHDLMDCSDGTMCE